MPEGLAGIIAQIAAGAGADKATKAIGTLIDKMGPQGLELLSSPQFTVMQIGAGLKDFGNSVNALMPIISSLIPKQPEQPAPPPPGSPTGNPADLMQMLASRLGPGQSGLQLAPPPPPGIGGPGGPPQGIA